MGSVHKSLYIFLVSQFSRQIYGSWEVLVEINIENIVDKSCLRYAIVADICKKIYMWTFILQYKKSYEDTKEEIRIRK